nr:hypothetical protein [Tanacetum cinerariifolium]
MSEHKQNLLDKEALIYLSLCLAKYGLPVNAAIIIRKLVETEQFPPVTAWSAILAYMSQTAAGAYLAAELVVEIGFMFQDGRVDPRKKSNEQLIAMKPNTTAVNVALAGCLLFSLTRKAEQLLDMIPRIGVKTDISMLITMGHIYERNGRREELKKLKRYVDEAHDLSDGHYREFYNSLLSCHLKFGDLESASHMVLEMLRKSKKAQSSLAKKIKELVGFLVNIEKEDSPVSPDCSPLVQVINSCISLGWLDQAHDLLDEMRLCGVKTGSAIYSSLLKAYCKENRSAEVKSLLKDARRAGVQLDASSYNALIESHVVNEDTHGALNLFKEMKEAKLDRTRQDEFDKLVQGCVGSGEAKLMAKLLHEIKDVPRVDCGVHEWNNVIHFFCRKRLMQDAEKALKKMRSLGHAPNAQTFHSLVTGYAAVGGKYTEVTELWGEMKGKAPKVQTESQLNRREAALMFKKWVGLF